MAFVAVTAILGTVVGWLGWAPGTSHAGRWTVIIDCADPANFGNTDPRGWFHAQHGAIEFTAECTGPWNPTITGRRGNRVARNSLAIGAGAFAGGYSFLAPGHPYLRFATLGRPHAAPDEAFAPEARIARVTHTPGQNSPAGSFYRRTDRRYVVGLFAADAHAAVAGYPLEQLQRVVGCTANVGGIQASEWPGAPASNCDSTVPFADGDGQILEAPRSSSLVDLRWWIGCASCPGPGNDSTAAIMIAGTRITLEDTTAPQVAIRVGGLNGGARAVQGTQSLGFDAKDLMGLDRATLVIDGEVAGDVEWPCANRDGQAGIARLPCDEGLRQQLSQSIAVDTTALVNGLHSAVLQTYDALGNRRDVPFEFRTYNESVDRRRKVERRVEGFTATGSPTQIRPVGRRGRTTKRSGVTLRRWSVGPTRSSRPQIRGELRGRRRPIRRAALAVFVRNTRGLFRRKRDIRTNRHGRFTYRLPPGPSRDVTFVYRGGQGRRGAIGEVATKVRARVGIRTSRRNARNGQTVHFGGRVRGTMPRRGVFVELQAFQRGRWRTFQQVRTRGKRGIWRAQHRFQTVSGATSFRFRARTRPQTGFPYSTGTSRVIRVHVRG